MIRTLCLLAAAAFGAPETETPPDAFVGNEELAAYLLEAEAAHPGLQARHETWQAALLRVPQVTSLADPMFGIEQMLRPKTDRTTLKLSQRFPWFGTRRLRGEVAAAEAEAAYHAYREARNAVFLRVKRAYHDYAFLADSKRVLEEQVALFDAMTEVAAGRLAAGLSAQEELLRIEIRRAQRKDRWKALLQERPAAAARLNEALGRPIHQQVPWPAPLAHPPDPPAAPFAEAWIRARNPALDAWSARIAGRERATELARRAGYPEFTVEIEYTFVDAPRQGRPERRERNFSPPMNDADNGMAKSAGGNMGARPMRREMDGGDMGKNELMAGLMFNLPIQRGRVRAGIAEAERLQSEAALDKTQALRMLEVEARNWIYELEDAKRRHALYVEQLLPKAELVQDGLAAAYGVAEAGVSLIDLLESVDTLRDLEIARIRALRDWRVAAAEIEFLLGGPWTEDETEEPAHVRPGGRDRAVTIFEADELDEEPAPGQETREPDRE